ncbi:MAG: DUF72 domain-containing protein, partial [Vicinamibacterales bacterium]
MSTQIPLFDLPPRDKDDEAARALDAVYAEARAIATELPPEIFFGTSSWSFPGWMGLVYSGSSPANSLSREGLREYARHPLLRTVGIDRTYYAPILVDELRAYASQLPDGFRCCTKAPASVTALTLGHGGPGSAINPHFLSADRLIHELLLPFALVFQEHTGPFILEFPPFPRQARLEPAAFIARLDRFLGQLPREFDYAVELRDARLLTPAYRDVLARHRVAHTFNYWSAMPRPAAQADIIRPEDLPFTVLRLLLRPGTWYEDQREQFRPFNAIVQPDELMREEVTSLSDRALTTGRKVWVLVNNKAEGSSPLTIMELAKRVAAR